MNLPFGKFKGLSLEQIPDDYLGWLSGLDLRDERLRLAIEEERQRRIFLAENTECVNLRLVDEIVSAGLRVPAKRYHPDHGGKHEQMQMVNICADWIRAQAREVVTQ